MMSLNNLNTRSLILRDLLIIIFSGIVVRVGLFFIFDYQFDLYGGDSDYYIKTGKNIVEFSIHGPYGVPTFYRPPLYSFFAGIIANISETAVFFYLVQSIIFITFASIVYFLLRRYGAKLAFVSALLIAVSPFDALMNGRVLSENLVTPLLVLGVLIFMHSNNSKVLFFLSGIMLGGVALCRDVYLLFPCLLLLAGIYMRISWRHLAVFLLGFLILVGPWAYRNSQMASGGVFLSNGIFWTNVWIGVWERDATWTQMPNPYVPPPEALLTYDNGNSPSVVMNAFKNEDQKFFRAVTLDYILNQPFKVIYTWVARYPLLWFGTRSDLNTSYLTRGSVTWYSLKIIFFGVNAIIIIFALLGIFIALRKKNFPLLLCLPVIYNAVIYIPLHNVETRYSLPVMPILTIYCSFFILQVVANWPRGLALLRATK